MTQKVSKGKSMRMRRYLGVMAALGTVIQFTYPTVGGEFAVRHNMPPAQRLAEPGPMVGGLDRA